MKNLIPNAIFHDVCDITAEWLLHRGVRALALDQDNTLARYSEDTPSREVCDWLDALKAQGFSAILVSNTRRDGRVRKIAEALGIDYVGRAGKPRPDGFIEAARRLGLAPDHILAVGDQIFTDIWGAKRAGMQTAIVYPRGMDEHLFFRLRRAVELPFIHAAKRGRAHD